MSDAIKLLLQAEINKSSIENIKSQLDGLQKNIKPIKIDIQTNGNQTQSTLNKIKETQQQLSSLKSKPMQLIDVQELQKSGAEFERYYKSLDGTMNKISDSYKKMGRVTIEGQKFDEVTKEVNKFTVKVEEAEGIVKKYTYTLKQLLEVDGKSHGKGSLAFVLDDIKGVDKSAEIAEKNLRQMHDVRVASNKEAEKEVQSAQKLEEVTKKTLSLDLDKLSKRYSGIVKQDDIANIQSMISALKFDDPNLGHNIDLIKVKMKEVSMGAENSRKSLDLANKSSMSFGEAMKTAAYKFGM